MTDSEHALRRASEMLDELGVLAGSGDPAGVHAALADVACRRLDGVGSASVTTWDGRRFATAAATDEAARRADRLQHDRNAGPGVTALRHEPLSHVPDLSDGDGWPADARDEVLALGFGGALSLRLTPGPPAQTPANPTALTLYSHEPHAFDSQAVQLASLLAIHARMALAAADGESRARHLERSRQTTQQIGAAVGVLMVRYEIGHDEAMQMLRTTSQRSNTRVSDLAGTVIETRELPRLDNRGPRPRT